MLLIDAFVTSVFVASDVIVVAVVNDFPAVMGGKPIADRFLILFRLLQRKIPGRRFWRRGRYSQRRKARRGRGSAVKRVLAERRRRS